MPNPTRLVFCALLLGGPLLGVTGSLRSAIAPGTTYATTPAFPSLTFNQPLALVSPPGDTRRLFVVEKTGRIIVISDVTAPSRSVFLDLSGHVQTSPSANDERGLLALAFHPNYATNGEFFVWYTVDATTAAGSGLHNRLSRFRVSSTDPNIADPNFEQPLLTQYDEASNHNGGELLFGPDGFLYLSLGDEGGANNQYRNGQRIDRDFFAGILRLDVDRRPASLPPNPHPAVHPGTYAIPPDNPFVGATTFNTTPITPSDVRTEFWATGLRNPWRMAFDSATGALWCADVGQGSREEINVITPGGNYGWDFREGNATGPRGAAPNGVALTDPIWGYGRSDGGSVTGGFVYRGPRYPSLAGHYLFADFASGRIWALEPDGSSPVAADRIQVLTTDTGIASFGLDPSNGDILLADLRDNTVKRLVATALSAGLPGRMVNLSARAQAGSGGMALITGFVIPPGGNKAILLRGVGPTLSNPPFSISGSLADPVLTLYGPDSPTSVAATNDNWLARDAAAFAAAGAFSLPTGSRDAAIIATLSPGAYTAQISSPGSLSGVALIELYDLGSELPGSDTQLVNTSVRALVGSDADVLIPGIVIGGGGERTVLIRAIGPGLARPPFNVDSALPDPTLRLFAASQLIASNTFWRTASNAAEISAAASRVGAFALENDNRDSALLVTLAPGSYTTHVSGARGNPGVVLVEIYAVP